jgi:hypothetical protein
MYSEIMSSGAYDKVRLHNGSVPVMVCNNNPVQLKGVTNNIGFVREAPVILPTKKKGHLSLITIDTLFCNWSASNLLVLSIGVKI